MFSRDARPTGGRPEQKDRSLGQPRGAADAPGRGFKPGPGAADGGRRAPPEGVSARQRAGHGRVRGALRPRGPPPDGRPHPRAAAEHRGASRSRAGKPSRGAHRVVRDFRGAAPVLVVQVGSDGLRQLESLRGVVARVVEDRPRRPALSESVPRIQADQALALGYDGTGMAIVVMDTGIEKDHPFLQDGTGASRVVGEACFSSNDPSAFATSLCPGAPSTPGGTSSTDPGSGSLPVDDRRLQPRHAGRRHRRRPGPRLQRGRAGRRPHLDPGLLAVQ